MIDTEVMRLRKLRNMALRVRAVAAVLSTECTTQQRTIAISALVSWRVARLITGRLWAHPNLSYQKGPHRIRHLLDRAAAVVIGATLRHRGHAVRAYAAQVQNLARELDDTRALTWDQDWSDTLGRAHRQLRGVMQLLPAVASPTARVAERRIATNSRLPANGRRLDDVAISNDWPYLAF
jgi:hypothetical protein